MTYTKIIFSKEDRVATIVLNNPERMNSYGAQMEKELEQAITDVDRDDSVRALIVTGAGKGFCSGHDWKEGPENQPPAANASGAVPKLEHYPPLLILKTDKPVIAAVNGPAAGGGLALALLCDIRIASEKATFMEAHAVRGAVPGAESWLLPRFLGLGKALEYIFTGTTIDARKAEQLGLVNRVVPHERLMPEAIELAQKIAKGPPTAMKFSKRAVYKGLSSDLDTTMEYVVWARALVRASGETDEGKKAFLEKRRT